jgi:hypothetical protein
MKSLKVSVNTAGTYVYLHRAGGKVFYVGAGAAFRPFHTYGRDAAWHKIVAGNRGCFEVEILGWYADKSAARAHELRAINRLKPACNITRYSVVMPRANGELKRNKALAPSTIEAMRLISGGTRVAEAAALAGADRSTVYKAIKRKKAMLARIKRV